jgi:hypothetical protein
MTVAPVYGQVSLFFQETASEKAPDLEPPFQVEGAASPSYPDRASDPFPSSRVAPAAQDANRAAGRSDLCT